MDFELLSDITDIEIIAVSNQIRDLAKLQEEYGQGRWRKLKGKAYIREVDGAVILAEVHWYECHGIGRRRMKIKRYLEER